MTEPSAYIISNNQEEYAYLGAKWLFETLGGKGDVVYMRGAAGASADSDRDKGFKRALAEFPDIKVAHEVFTGWQQDQGKQQILDFIATGIPFDGIWTSGIDNVIVDALVESQATLVPVVGADNAGFVGQLNSVEGLQGAAVTNPGSIGGAGVTLALQILDGQKPDAADGAGAARALGERDRRGQGEARGRRRPVAQPRMAGQDLDPGLDDLHQGADRRLQGSGRVAARNESGRGDDQGLSTRRPPQVILTDPERRTVDLQARDDAIRILDASGVAKRYGAVAALRNASLSVRPGEVHALMGANGAGKSTLVKILTGAVRPDAGRILIRGRGARGALAGRRPPRRAGPGLPGAGADPRPRRRRQSAADRHAGRAVPRMGARARRARPRPRARSPATCRSPSCASSTSRARWRSSPTCCSSTR